MAGRRWTLEELEILDLLYPEASWRTLRAALPDRTVSAIRVQSCLQGLKRTDQGRGAEGSRMWTEQDSKKILRGVEAGLSLQQITTSFRGVKTYGSVAGRMHTMGLRTTGEGAKIRWLPEDEAQLKMIYRTVSWGELERAFPERSREAIRRHAVKLGLHRTRGFPWTPEQDAQIREIWAAPWCKSALIEKRVGRSMDTCKDRAFRLGLIRNQQRVWIPDDLRAQVVVATWLSARGLITSHLTSDGHAHTVIWFRARNFDELVEIRAILKAGGLWEALTPPGAVVGASSTMSHLRFSRHADVRAILEWVRPYIIGEKRRRQLIAALEVLGQALMLNRAA